MPRLVLHLPQVLQILLTLHLRSPSAHPFQPHASRRSHLSLPAYPQMRERVIHIVVVFVV